MEMTPRFYAKGLDELLETQGRKATWVADRVGLHKTTLSKVALRERTVSLETGKAIADLLQVPFAMLFELSSDVDMTSLAEVA